MSANYTGIGHPFESFYPINVKLRGKRVLVVGGNAASFCQTGRLVEFGALVDVVASHMATELHDLAITYGDRITLHRRKFSVVDAEALSAGTYTLVLVFAADEEECRFAASAAQTGRTPVHVLYDTLRSDFMVPTLVKRGHLKLSVSTDAISPPLERAVLQRIEAMFVSEIDSYTLFLTSMKELIETIRQDKHLASPNLFLFRQVISSLSDSEEILLALQRKNFEEASHLARYLVAQIISEAGETAVSVE